MGIFRRSCSTVDILEPIIRKFLARNWLQLKVARCLFHPSHQLLGRDRLARHAIQHALDDVALGLGHLLATQQLADRLLAVHRPVARQVLQRVQRVGGSVANLTQRRCVREGADRVQPNASPLAKQQGTACSRSSHVAGVAFGGVVSGQPQSGGTDNR